MIKTLPFSEAHRRLDDVIEDITLFGHEYLITKEGQPPVRMVPANIRPAIEPELKKWIDEFCETFGEDLEYLASH